MFTTELLKDKSNKYFRFKYNLENIIKLNKTEGKKNNNIFHIIDQIKV